MSEIAIEGGWEQFWGRAWFSEANLDVMIIQPIGRCFSLLPCGWWTEVEAYLVKVLEGSRCEDVMAERSVYSVLMWGGMYDCSTCLIIDLLKKIELRLRR